MSALKPHNKTVITINFNGNESQLLIPKNSTSYTWANEIINRFNINLSEYDIIYENNIIPVMKTLYISHIIGDNIISPIFSVKQKYEIKKSQYSLFVIIENYPSFRDLNQQLSIFKQSIGWMNIVYDWEFRNGWCKFSFTDQNLGYLFIQFISGVKYTNYLYRNMRIKMRYPNEILNTNNNANSSIHSNNISNINNWSHSLSHRQWNVIEDPMEDLIKYNNKSSFGNYYSMQKLVRNSSPYMSMEEMKRLEERIGKKKWLTKDGFVSSVGKNSLNYKYRDINNYVNETPSESPLVYKIRNVDKRNWIAQKGFMF